MQKSNSTWNDIIKPVVVLTAICIVVSAALAYTNSITKPIIDENAARAADAARIEVLPQATEGFTKIEIEKDNILEMYKANNDVGYVITSTASGYGGLIKFMTAYDNDGKIVDVKILEINETPGLGMKINERAFLDQFVGKSEEFTKDNIDIITGVTISSKAAMAALNSALEAYNQEAKGIVVVKLTFEEELEQYFGNMTPTTEFSSEKAVEFYNSDKGLVIVTEGKGNGIIGDEHVSGYPLRTYTSFDENGVITGVMFDTSSETTGLGDVIAEDDFVNQFIGKENSEGVDVIANATYSSKGAIGAIAAAAEVFAEIKG